MDIGTLAAWIQTGIWVFTALLWIGRILRGKTAVPPTLKRILSSNGLLGVVIGLGLVMSVLSLYISYRFIGVPDEMTVNVSTFEPQPVSPMAVISDKSFQDQDVPLDGNIYRNSTFTNVCFLYDGGAYSIENSKVKDAWKVCVRDKRLQNYNHLLLELKEFNPRITYSGKTVVFPPH